MITVRTLKQPHSKKDNAMRQMKIPYSDKPVKVYGWAIAQNGWEYYFLDNKNGDTRFAYVCGFENEMGDVSIREIRPYLRAITFQANDLNTIAPAPECEWVD